MSKKEVEQSEREQYIQYFREMEPANLVIEKKEVEEALVEFEELDNKFAALVRLEENDDWKLFKDMYFKDEKERLSNALTSVNPFREETEKQLMQKLIGIRQLKLFFQGIEIEATGSGEALIQIKDRLEYINFVIDEKNLEVD